MLPQQIELKIVGQNTKKCENNSKNSKKWPKKASLLAQSGNPCHL
jgi:hypothetical protein